jgi:hypothetical protein
MKVFFEPIHEPAKSIYHVLIKEAENRNSKPVEKWIEDERMAVFNSANNLSHAMNLNAPTLEQVIIAEIRACGHVDYAAKFAYGVAEFMKQ